MLFIQNNIPKQLSLKRASKVKERSLQSCEDVCCKHYGKEIRAMKTWPLHLRFPCALPLRTFQTLLLILTLAQTGQFCVPGGLLELQTFSLSHYYGMQLLPQISKRSQTKGEARGLAREDK